MTFEEWIKDNYTTSHPRDLAEKAWNAQEAKLNRISELVGDEAGPYFSTGELMDLIRGVLQD